MDKLVSIGAGYVLLIASLILVCRVEPRLGFSCGSFAFREQE